MILSAAVDNGQPGYPWLVFLHGFSGDRNEWRKVGDAFPAWPRLYLDLPGHGGSADIAVQDFAGVKIEETEDFAKDTKTLADGTVEKLGMPDSNVLRYVLADETWIAIRPSGTEPKLKFYIGTAGSSNQEANQKLADFEAALTAFANE